MMKSMCALVHRPGTHRDLFQHYYEARHAPLAIRHFPFSRYVRNHVVGSQICDFDTISEFWADDIGRTAALMEGPVGAIMREDEERFMDRTRIAPAGCDEMVLSAGAFADQDGLRTLVLLRGGREGTWRDDIIDWAGAYASGHGGVTLDFLSSWATPGFPAQAVLGVPGETEVPNAPAGISAQRVLVRRAETPESSLLPNL